MTRRRPSKHFQVDDSAAQTEAEAATAAELANKERKDDMVNHPPHYQGRDRYGRPHEVVDCCEAHSLDSACAQAVQYIMRSEKKGKKLEDLEKALWWLTRAVENEHIDQGTDKGVVLVRTKLVADSG